MAVSLIADSVTPSFPIHLHSPTSLAEASGDISFSSSLPEGLDLNLLEEWYKTFKAKQEERAKEEALIGKFGKDVVRKWDAQQKLGAEFRDKNFFIRLFHILYPSSYTHCVPHNQSVEFLTGHTWEVWKEGPCFHSEPQTDLTMARLTSKPQYVIDPVTGEPFLNEDEDCTGRKMLLIFCGNVIPLVPALYACATVGYTLSDLKDCACNIWHFDSTKPWESLKKALVPLMRAIARLVFLPLILLAFFAIAIHGLDCPREARHLYAKLERLVFNQHYVLAPCFQPYPTTHFFGSCLSTANGM